MSIDSQGKGYLLLVNARPEKGFDLLLEVAARCPDVDFVAIAHQSSRSDGLAAVEEAGLSNVQVIERTDDMDPLYEGARAVAVPSYRFVETFSRVSIEAHRHGKPVLGSDQGNVPLLLAQSGIVLKEDPDDWAAQINRIFGDDDYYTQLCRLARANSARYSQSTQYAALNGVLNGLHAPILVGVGSGIGNMLHVGPMIRNIARRTGRPVDLLVAGDHPGTLFLLHHPRYVNAVYALGQAALDRYYDTVFMAHAAGGVRLPLGGRRVIWREDWRAFRPGHSLHETIFNLEAAKVLLGIPYDEDDIRQHYVGNKNYRWPGGKIVGFHGGSKDGHWASKRWGGFARLAALLAEAGYEVRSFGVPEEYVAGTTDCTGGTVEQMVDGIMACSYFVSNDSGLMNIANALGIPTLALFGPTDVGTRGPLSRLARTLSVEKDCAPCEVKDTAHFRLGTCTCIDELPVERVFDTFTELAESARSELGK